MIAVESRIWGMLDAGKDDDEIVAQLVNSPLPDELAELKAAAGGDRPAMSMVNLVQSAIERVRAEQMG